MWKERAVVTLIRYNYIEGWVHAMRYSNGLAAYYSKLKDCERLTPIALAQ